MSDKNEINLVAPNSRAIPEPLKYYDPELQIAWNTEPFDEARVERARAKSDQLRRDYIAQLAKLRSRLSQRTYERFAKPRDPLFDSDLVEFRFGDWLCYPHRRQRGTSIYATFLSFDYKRLHTLHYRSIHSLQVNVPENRWFEWPRQKEKEIDSLLVHELTAAGEGLMRHQFLFASGTAMSIKFARITWQARRATKK